MPVDNGAAPELLPTPEQRKDMDFQNDGAFVGGAICTSTPRGYGQKATPHNGQDPLPLQRVPIFSSVRRRSRRSSPPPG